MSGRHRGWGRHAPQLSWVRLTLVLAPDGGVYVRQLRDSAITTYDDARNR